ncbi:hypothetical protein B0H13DRAFT_2326060 [Mycena leptocephala]|nr:hypothetical protein B0H13DRAFT_2326060 [Mycena leptocephala]
MSESPTIPRKFRLQGHYLSDARVITVARGSRDVVLHTPTPIVAPPINEQSVDDKPRILRYISAKHPYLVFVPKYEPWDGPLFDVLRYSWPELPIIEREDGQWELKQDVAETWHNLEACLRVVGALILEIVGIAAPDFSTFLSPGRFRTHGWFYKTEAEARTAAWVGRTNFLPLIGLISMALWCLEHCSDNAEQPATVPSNANQDSRPWREQVIEKTKVRGQWLDMLAISLAADWTFERVGGLYRVGILDNGPTLEERAWNCLFPRSSGQMLGFLSWNLLDEPRVNYYVIRERDKPLVDSRVLYIDDVVKRLVSRGMSFRLAFVSPPFIISWTSFRRRPVVDVYGGLGFRHEGYAPDMDDYFSYEMQRNFQFLHTNRGFIALQYGGLVSRLARSETDLNDLLHSLDNGVPEFADCLWDSRSDYAFWFQSLSPRELELLCGVYHIATGNTGRKKDGTVTLSKNPGGSYEQRAKLHGGRRQLLGSQGA